MSFGERLRLARKAKNMSQQELADELGISINSIANYERGTSFPKEDYLYKIMSIFDLDPNYLFQDELGMNSGLWIEENNLLNKYRHLDKRDRSVVNSLVAKSMEKTIISRLAVRDRELSAFCITVKNHVYGLFAYADALDISKMSVVSEDVDYSVMIKGKGLEPAFKNGTVFGFKYADELKNNEMGLFEIGGYAVIAVKKGRKLINGAGKDIAADFYGIRPILLGRLSEVHINE